MKKVLGRNCAFKRTAHKEQDCGELCECSCHKQEIPAELKKHFSDMGKKSWQKKLEQAKSRSAMNGSPNPQKLP